MSIQAYPSRVDDDSARKLGTFSYLPQMTAEQVREQIDYMLGQGWTCSIEHVEPARATSRLWYMWKLPMFGVTDADTVLEEIEACHQANPRDHVRVIGYDAKRQTQGLAFVVHRG